MAVLELINGNGDVFVLHWEFGPVIITPLSPLWVGATAHSNNVGEIIATRKALEWASKWLFLLYVEVVVVYDSQLAADFTQGKLKVNAKNRLHSDLGLASKNTHDEVSAQTTLSFQHNRGHAGHKYNEMVDSLAKLGVESSTNMATRLHPFPRELAE